MTAEDNFVSKFRAFVNDSEIFTEIMERRLRLYLNEYKEELPEKLVLIDKPTTHIKYVPTKRTFKRKENLPKATETVLKHYAKEFCKTYEVDYDEFMKAPKGKSTWQITSVRKEFCKYIICNYECSQQILKDFFKIDHSTIVYYLRGKKNVA